MNLKAQSEFNTFLRNIMFDPDICKEPGVHQIYCKVIDNILEIYRKGANEHQKFIKESSENSQGIHLLSYQPTNFLAEEVPEPESSTRPKKQNQSGRQSCNPDSKGKAPQCDDDDDNGMGGSRGPANQRCSSTHYIVAAVVFLLHSTNPIFDSLVHI